LNLRLAFNLHNQERGVFIQAEDSRKANTRSSHAAHSLTVMNSNKPKRDYFLFASRRDASAPNEPIGKMGKVPQYLPSLVHAYPASTFDTLIGASRVFVVELTRSERFDLGLWRTVRQVRVATFSNSLPSPCRNTSHRGFRWEYKLG
jgi:hypothetical protein